jgi:8-oxo-dGTP pyrophosphatase MutT (NUDIX family)
VSWQALAAARRRDASRRVPFVVDGRAVGSVDRNHLQALAAWPTWLRVDAEHVELMAQDRDAALATINARLRDLGLVRAWRDELFALFDPQTGERLASTERAACRFWGTLTLGAHANGYVADAQGRPTHLWIARRSASKATDPGLLDNLIGGGVADGQSPRQALVREAWEEAGLSPQQVELALPGRVLRLHRDITEGLQLEDLHTFDIPMPAHLQPVNQDGEVAGFDCLPVQQALKAAAGSGMTVDAALVTLDFALRHRLMEPATADLLSPLLTLLTRRS